MCAHVQSSTGASDPVGGPGVEVAEEGEGFEVGGSEGLAVEVVEIHAVAFKERVGMGKNQFLGVGQQVMLFGDCQQQRLFVGQLVDYC